MATELNLFFRSNEKWLEDVLTRGIEGAFVSSINTVEESKIFIAFVQGILLLSQASGDIKYFDTLTVNYMRGLN
ncbi:hypothetical protein [Paenibacillus sp. sgz500958]|uniref:hypothetical protein n=1 Tax=Paenibacillus sp. sgz500958 TaxID=3242475 RepID=UPI0036D32479